MKLRQEKLTGLVAFSSFDNVKGKICQDGLRQVFDLPDTKTIWLTVHNRPSKWRVAVRDSPYNDDGIRLDVEGHGLLLFYREAVHIIRRLLEKRDVVYVECEYLGEPERIGE